MIPAAAEVVLIPLIDASNELSITPEVVPIAVLVVVDTEVGTINANEPPC